MKRAVAVTNFGTITLEQANTSKPLHVRVDVCHHKMHDGDHGFHIHEYGDTRAGCASMGSHYNPHNYEHGSPHHSLARHAGDLGNLSAKDGCIRQKISIGNVNISNIVGRGIVIHERPDDLGMGQGPAEEESKRTGNAGARIVCAPIVWTD